MAISMLRRARAAASDLLVFGGERQERAGTTLCKVDIADHSNGTLPALTGPSLAGQALDRSFPRTAIHASCSILSV